MKTKTLKRNKVLTVLEHMDGTQRRQGRNQMSDQHEADADAAPTVEIGDVAAARRQSDERCCLGPYRLERTRHRIPDRSGSRV